MSSNDSDIILLSLAIWALWSLISAMEFFIFTFSRRIPFISIFTLLKLWLDLLIKFIIELSLFFMFSLIFPSNVLNMFSCVLVKVLYSLLSASNEFFTESFSIISDLNFFSKVMIELSILSTLSLVFLINAFDLFSCAFMAASSLLANDVITYFFLRSWKLFIQIDGDSIYVEHCKWGHELILDTYTIWLFIHYFFINLIFELW